MTDAFPLEYSPPANLLEGRVVLVTGAGQGLGRALALDCAAHGATVALLGRTLEKLESTYDAIVESGGPEPALIPPRSPTARATSCPWDRSPTRASSNG